MAARQWPENVRPGNDIVRLCAVRVRREDGRLAEVFDIRDPVRIEMEYHVLQPGYVLVPNFSLFGGDGLLLFITSDLDPTWRRRPRPVGRYLSTVHVPGNLLSEDTSVVSPAVNTLNPIIHYIYEPDAVAFRVIDTMDGDSARGDYGGPIPSAVRPLLDWTNTLTPGVADEEFAFEAAR